MGGIGVMSWVCLGVFCISSAIHHAYARAPKARCPASKKQSLLSDCFFFDVIPILTVKSYFSVLFLSFVQIFPYSQADRLFQTDHSALSPPNLFG